MTAPTLLDWLLIAAVALLLGLVVVQITRANRNEEHLAELRRWAHEQDPAHFGIYPDLPGAPAPDCEADGGFHVAGEVGSKCANCPADLTPVRSV